MLSLVRDTPFAAQNLHNAARRGLVDVVQALLDNGADIEDRDDDSNSPLMVAAEWGREAVVDTLLRAGASVAATNRFDKTALMFACQRGHAGVTTQLVNAGSDVGAQNRLGYTPLMLAAEAGHADVVDVVMKTADLDQADRVRVLAGCGGSRMVQRLTGLCCGAVRRNRFDGGIVSRLVQCGATACRRWS